MGSLRFLRIVISFVLCFSSISQAQVSRTGGELLGTVVDQAGLRVGGATVEIRNSGTNQERVVKTDDNGEFRLGNLPSATYVMSVEKQGFGTYTNRSISISVGSVSQLTVRLKPGEVRQELTVTEQPAGVDVTQATVATTIDPERIEELPVRSRSYLSFALLVPGVSATNSTAATPLFLNDSGFSFGGLRPRSNSVFIDGVSNNDEYTGSIRTELSLETVREFQVVNHGLYAGSGGAAGGSIDVVTKPGQNIYHGDAFIFAENGALDARPALENAPGKPDLNRYRVGLSLGGPIVRDRMFFYAGFEQEHSRGQAASDVSPQLASTINDYLLGNPSVPFPRVTYGYFPTSRAETELSGRFDENINQNNALMLRYSFTNNREVNDAFPQSELVDASARGSAFVEDNALMGGLTSVFESTLVNDLRFQLAWRRVTTKTVDQTGPGAEIPGLIAFGRPYSDNDARQENYSELSDSVSIQKGRHLFKLGAGIERIHISANSPDGFGGWFIFPALASFLAGQPAYYQQGLGDPNTEWVAARMGGFVQDHWTVSSNLTLDLGVRYDFEHLPDVFTEDTNNVAPRVGFALQLSPRSVLRGGFGIFYDRYVLAFLNQALQKNGQNGFDQIAEGDVAAHIYRAPLPSGTVLPGIAPSVFRPQPNLRTPYSQVATLGVQHELSPMLTVGATYNFVRGLKLPRTLNANLPPPVLLTPENAGSLGITNPYPQQLGRYVFGPQRLDPAYDGTYQLQNAASSTYNGISFTLNRRLANEFELLASYTFSKTIDDASDFNESPQNPYDLRAERALSLNNQAHRFAVSALFDLPIGEAQLGSSRNALTRIFSNIEAAPILVVGSGRPADALTGLDSSGTHTYPLASRPLGYGRNMLLTPATVSLDLRVLKAVKLGAHGKLDIVAESFNLLNHTNITQANPFFGTQSQPISTFAQPVAASNPRQLQFSLDYEV